MDLSIWDPPENQVTDESSYPANSWQYNLYFDPRLDVIEEDALNEKSCMQVLKILINKADSEIVELEDDILMLESQLACDDDMCLAALDKKIDNLDSMLRALKNENEQPAEPGVRSSNMPEECLNKMEATANHNSKDIKTVKFKDGCTTKANDTVLASLVQPAGTTLEDRHASEQETEEYISKPTKEGVKAVQIHDKRTSEQWVKTNMASINFPSEVKGQEVMHTETDCTIEETRLLNSQTNDRSKPQKKLKSGGDDYGDQIIKETLLAGATGAGGFADISTTSQSHSRKRSGASVIQENKDQRNVQDRLVKTHDRTSQEPLVMHGSSYNDSDVLQSVKIVFPMSSITPSDCIADINRMSLVQLKAFANQHNIYGVSNTRKADLLQLLRSKLQAKNWT